MNLGIVVDVVYNCSVCNASEVVEISPIRIGDSVVVQKPRFWSNDSGNELRCPQCSAEKEEDHA